MGLKSLLKVQPLQVGSKIKDLAVAVVAIRALLFLCNVKPSAGLPDLLPLVESCFFRDNNITGCPSRVVA